MRGEENAMRRLSYVLVAASMLTLGPFVPPVPAQPTSTGRVMASLNCGSHSANPKQHKSFQVDLPFDLYGSLWTLDRKTSPQAGEEKFRGILSPTGMMLIAGQGQSDNGETWTYEFSGQKNPKGVTILKGSLRSEKPKGTRTCSLTF
jgi:hypothetical protein